MSIPGTIVGVDKTTGVFSVVSGLNDVIKLQNECTGFSEKRNEPRDVLEVRPYYTVTLDWLRCRSSPNYLTRLVENIRLHISGKPTHSQHSGR